MEQVSKIGIPIGCSNDKNIFLVWHSIHFSENLIDYTISRTSSITNATATGFCHGIQLIEEKHTWCCGARLENVFWKRPACKQYYVLRAYRIPVWITLSNTSRTLASDSPNHIVNSSGPFMEMKFAWHSCAIAFANKVLPQPGGP